MQTPRSSRLNHALHCRSPAWCDTGTASRGRRDGEGGKWGLWRQAHFLQKKPNAPVFNWVRGKVLCFLSASTKHHDPTVQGTWPCWECGAGQGPSGSL